MRQWSDRPRVAADAILMMGGKLVLVKRGHEPFEGCYALPGGFVECGETTEEAAKREVLEETGVRTAIKSLFGVYSTPDRDPRGHTVSVVYELRRVGGRLKSGSDAAAVRLFPLSKIPPLAFDHDEIVADFRRKVA